MVKSYAEFVVSFLSAEYIYNLHFSPPNSELPIFIIYICVKEKNKLVLKRFNQSY